jgi:hypothetical protein
MELDPGFEIGNDQTHDQTLKSERLLVRLLTEAIVNSGCTVRHSSKNAVRGRVATGGS